MRARYQGRTPKARQAAERRGLPRPNTGPGWSTIDLDEFRQEFEADYRKPIGIGPGPAYALPTTVGEARKSSFLGVNIERGLPVSGPSVPGPGAYKPDSALGRQAVSTRPTAPQTKITRADRFVEQEKKYNGAGCPSPVAPTTPGPGAYAVPTSFDTPVNPDRLPLPATPEEKSPVPGPGSYPAPSSLSATGLAKTTGARDKYWKQYDGPQRTTVNADPTPGFNYNVTHGDKGQYRTAPRFTFGGGKTQRKLPKGSMRRSKSQPSVRRAEAGSRRATPAAEARKAQRALAYTTDYSWLSAEQSPSPSSSKHVGALSGKYKRAIDGCEMKLNLKPNVAHSFGTGDRFGSGVFVAHRPQALDAADTPGPQYNTRADPTKSRGTNFGRNSAKFTGSALAAGDNGVPGPGHYNLRVEARVEEEEVIRSLAQLRADVARAEAEGRDVREAGDGFDYNAKHKAVLLRREAMVDSLTRKVPVTAPKTDIADPLAGPVTDLHYGEDPMHKTMPSISFAKSLRQRDKLFLGKPFQEDAVGKDSPGPLYNTASTRPHTPVWSFQGVVNRGPLTRDTSDPTDSDLAPLPSHVGGRHFVSRMRTHDGPSFTRAGLGVGEKLMFTKGPGAADVYKGRLSADALGAHDVAEKLEASMHRAPRFPPHEREVFPIPKERLHGPGPGAHGHTPKFTRPPMPRDPHEDDPIDRE